MDLGTIGVWTPAPGLLSAERARGAVEEIEGLGFRTIWYPESVGGKEALSQGAMLLSWTERIVIAAGIANIAARDPMAMANGARGLADAFPGRFLLGIGASTDLSLPLRGHEYGRPLTRMREYLDAMDEAAYLAPEPPEPGERILAALGPKMLALAAKRAIGAHPGFVPVEHTVSAREALGSGPVLAVEQPVLLVSNRAEAREIAAEHMGYYLARRPYRENMLRLGFSEADVEGAGSDSLFDAIRDRVRAHLEAGADHVCIEVVGSDRTDPQLEALRTLAPALLEL